MKIFFLTNFRLPNERGVSYGIVTMCRALAALGNEVELLAPDCEVPPEMKGKDIWHYHQIPKNIFRLTLLPFLHFPHPRLFYFFLKWTFSFSAWIYLLRKKPPILHLFNDMRELLLLLGTTSWLYRPRVVQELHMLPTQTSDRFLEKLTLARIDLLLVTTKIFAEHYLNRGFPSEKILIFPNGINLTDFDYHTPKKRLRQILNLPQNKFIVGYAGRFTTMGAEKGIPELIKAVARVAKIHQELLLVCIGGPESQINGYIKLAETSGLRKDQAIFQGSVPRSELYQFMRVFDVCAMPFPWTSHFAHNMSPLKMFEYMASKNPIVATDLPSITEILISGKNALLAAPGNPEDLSDKILSLVENPTLRKKLAQSAFKTVASHFTWNLRAKSEITSLLKLYNVKHS